MACEHVCPHTPALIFERYLIWVYISYRILLNNAIDFEYMPVLLMNYSSLFIPQSMNLCCFDLTLCGMQVKSLVCFKTEPDLYFTCAS